MAIDLTVVKGFLDSTQHPQIDKSEVKIVEKDDNDILACYLFNPVFDTDKTDREQQPVLVIESSEMESNVILLYRILHVPLDLRFIDDDTVNKILLDLPAAIGAKARFSRPFADEGKIRIELFERYDRNSQYQENNLYEVLSETLPLANNLIMIGFKALLGTMAKDSGMISKEDAEQKLDMALERVKQWNNFQLDTI